MKRRTDEEKARIVTEFRNGVPVGTLSKRYGVATSTIYTWSQQFDAREKFAEQLPAMNVKTIERLNDGTGFTTPNIEPLRKKLDRYWDVLQKSQLADKSVEDYYYFAECFVRWTEGSFSPGRQLQ